MHRVLDQASSEHWPKISAERPARRGCPLTRRMPGVSAPNNPMVEPANCLAKIQLVGDFPSNASVRVYAIGHPFSDPLSQLFSPDVLSWPSGHVSLCGAPSSLCFIGPSTAETGNNSVDSFEKNRGPVAVEIGLGP